MALSPEVDALRKAAGIESSLSTMTIGAWFVADDQLTNLVQLAKAERDAELRKQASVAEKSNNGIEWRFANTVDILPVGTKLYAEPMPPAEPLLLSLIAWYIDR